MIKENYLKQGMFKLTKKLEIMELLLIILGVFLIPIIIPYVYTGAINSQYIIGSIVNASLIIAGVNVKGFKKIIGIISLPSIYAIVSGLIFKTASIYMVFMIPFIWLGNFMIIYLYRYLFVHKKTNYVVASIISILVKVSIVFISINLLIKIMAINSNIALMLKTAMGLNQLITGILGSFIAFIVIHIIYKRNNKYNY